MGITFDQLAEFDPTVESNIDEAKIRGEHSTKAWDNYNSNGYLHTSAVLGIGSGAAVGSAIGAGVMYNRMEVEAIAQKKADIKKKQEREELREQYDRYKWGMTVPQHQAEARTLMLGMEEKHPWLKENDGDRRRLAE